jgi:hypothetical protein
MGSAVSNIVGFTVTPGPPFSSVILMMHANGVDGSTAFVDSSSYANPMNAGTTAHISTAQPKFGSGAATGFGNATLGLRVPDAAIFNFATVDWTIELWAYATTLGGRSGLVEKSDSFSTFNDPYFLRVQTNGAVQASGNYFDNTLAYDLTSSAGLITLNAYHFITLQRAGPTVTLFVDGVIQGTATLIKNLAATTNSLLIGGVQDSSSDRRFDGYIDDLRMTRGYARYSGNFTPPTAEFPNS